jgi:branched-chain amino acid aminotransferase
LCEQNDIPIRQKNFSLTDVYGAEEAFVTGTFAGLAPATEIDGRVIGDSKRGPMVERLQQLYLAMLERECA